MELTFSLSELNRKSPYTLESSGVCSFTFITEQGKKYEIGFIQDLMRGYINSSSLQRISSKRFLTEGFNKRYWLYSKNSSETKVLSLTIFALQKTIDKLQETECSTNGLKTLWARNIIVYVA